MGQDKKKYSQLRAMLALAVASLRSSLRSPSAVVFTLVFPLIFIVVFGFVGGGGFKVNVAVDPNIDKTSPVYKGLVSSNTVNFLENEKDVQAELEKGSIDAWLNIQNTAPQGMPHYIIDLKTSKASADKGMILKLILDETVDKMNLATVHVAQPMAELSATEVSGRKYSMIDFILPGMLGFSILSTGVFGTAFVFFNLRQTLVLKRFFATPVKRGYIIVAEAISRMTFAIFGALIIIVIGYFFFHFTLVHGFITVLNMMLVSAIGLLVFLGCGFIVSGLARNDSTIPVLANMITLPQFLLSGTFFSVKSFPPWLQNISNVLPLTHMNTALRKIAFEGASLFEVGNHLIVLAIWGVVIYIGAAKAFRWE
jgi:ABC-2 type transport system permease protein